LLPLTDVTVLSLEHTGAHYSPRPASWPVSAPEPSRWNGRSGNFARCYDESSHGLSSYFVWLNRSKESVAIGVKSDVGYAALRSLVRSSDVVVGNTGPGRRAAARQGAARHGLFRSSANETSWNLTPNATRNIHFPSPH
jgi:hypothetical protein